MVCFCVKLLGEASYFIDYDERKKELKCTDRKYINLLILEMSLARQLILSTKVYFEGYINNEGNRGDDLACDFGIILFARYFFLN